MVVRRALVRVEIGLRCVRRRLRTVRRRLRSVRSVPGGLVDSPRPGRKGVKPSSVRVGYVRRSRGRSRSIVRRSLCRRRRIPRRLVNASAAAWMVSLMRVDVGLRRCRRRCRTVRRGLSSRRCIPSGLIRSREHPTTAASG